MYFSTDQKVGYKFIEVFMAKLDTSLLKKKNLTKHKQNFKILQNIHIHKHTLTNTHTHTHTLTQTNTHTHKHTNSYTHTHTHA